LPTRNSTGFFSFFKDHDLHSHFYYWGPSKVLKGSEEELEKFKISLQRKAYPQALRDLRALVQQALENLEKFKGIEFETLKDPDINKFAALMIEKKVLEGRLHSWF
jgi:hypothetical protein